MSPYRTGLARQILIGKYTDWIKPFDVSEYVQNPPLIEKLYEEKQLALVDATYLENRLNSLEERLHELELEKQSLELEKQSLEIELAENSRKSSFSFVLSLLAVILVGIGVNISTSNPHEFTGWIMIASACVIEIAVFLIKPQGKESDGKAKQSQKIVGRC